MTTPMEIDADILTTAVPEVLQPTVPEQEPAPTEPTTDAPISKKKGRPAGSVTTTTTTTKKKTVEERVPGTTGLPVARVKRILGADEDLQNIGREALFLLSIATEQFLKRMADSGYVKARMDGRKTVTLKDLSNAVKHQPEMEFLSDIIPAAVPLSVALATRKKNAQDPKAFSNLDNQPLSSLLPPVPMFPSKNPDFPDALVRRLKDPNKARSARKSAAAAAAAAAAMEGEEGEPEGEEVTSVKKPKAKPKARKSAVVGPDADATSGVETNAVEMDGLQSTSAEQTAMDVPLSRPKPIKKSVAKPKEPPAPAMIRGSSDAAEDAMDNVL
ncbi:hypothetical protein NliqN6_5819 [Naganishia liquefaciens]|uniref:Transcription factor CBF/NF-Y/archaeal histone domain-containing protein n=1 Tax=Naganishia liquefaciens TaxID=104408 RepID=A0A8H3TYG6_9TREE|nr:hypothetical protein NliqN6_5819 [Naganishia liquefaciens]